MVPLDYGILRMVIQNDMVEYLGPIWQQEKWFSTLSWRQRTFVGYLKQLKYIVTEGRSWAKIKWHISKFRLIFSKQRANFISYHVKTRKGALDTKYHVDFNSNVRGQTKHQLVRLILWFFWFFIHPTEKNLVACMCKDKFNTEHRIEIWDW